MNKKNIIYTMFILFLFIIICFLSYGKNGGFIYDTFREALLPEQILNGKMLYKDIFCLYPPLAYYLNAFLFKLFGSSLKVLYIAGITNTFVILLCIYKITDEISKKRTVFITLLTVLLIFVLRMREPDCGNWLMPYSFSLIYAFSCCLISLTAYILFFKYKKLKYLYLSCLFIGLSIAFKLDYILFSSIILYTLLKEKSVKIFFKGLLLIISPIIFSILLFILINHCSLNTIKTELAILYKFTSVSNVISYNKTYMPQLITFEIVKNIYHSFLFFASCFLISLGIYFGIYKLYLKSKNKKIFCFLLGLCIFTLLFFTRNFLIGDNFYNFLFYKTELYLHNNFVFLSYFMLFSGIVLFIYKKLKKEALSNKEKLFYILLIISYTIAYRNSAGIFISNAGSFSVIPFLITFIFFSLEIIPNKVNFLNNTAFKNYFCFALILYSLTFALQYIHMYKFMTHKINLPKGCFYVSDYYYPIVNKALTHAKEHIQGTNKPLLYIEEGIYVNYLLDIPLIDLNLYSLQSHTIPILGEDFIISVLEEKSPEYIYNFVPAEAQFTHGEFGTDYAVKVYKYIKNKYDLEYKSDIKAHFFESGFYIYKRKTEHTNEK